MSALGNRAHMYFFLKLAWGHKIPPLQAFSFHALQVVALESCFAHLVADCEHVPSNTQHEPPMLTAPSVC